MSDLDRFMNFVHEEPNSGCWLWGGAMKSRNYGSFRYNAKYWRAHRWAAKFIGGMDTEGACVCHTCDNPSCVNPEHLWVGTQADNVEDMVDKGRQVALKGEAHPRSKLTDIARLRIAQLYEARLYTQKQLARAFDVSVSTVKRCVSERRLASARTRQG